MKTCMLSLMSCLPCIVRIHIEMRQVCLPQLKKKFKVDLRFHLQHGMSWGSET